ncbi:MAG: hypothetical protein ACRDCF_02580 [Mycoplasmoidaceae bacterium]
MKILLKNCTLPNYKKVNILIEDNIFTEISPNIIRVRPDVEFDLERKLVFPGIIDLSQNIFNTFSDKEKISNESKSFLKGGITSLINVENNLDLQNSYDINFINENSIVNLGESSVIDFFNDYSDKNYFMFNTLNIGAINVEEDDIEYWKWFQSRIFEIQKQSKVLFVSMKDPGINHFLKYVPKNNYKICFYDINSPNEIARITNFKMEGFNFYIAFDVNLFFIYKEMIRNCIDEKRLLISSGYSNVTNVQFFIDSLKRGLIDIVYSNHSPYMLWEKYELNKIGIPSSETLVPLMFELAWFSNIRTDILSKVLCENISEILNIDRRGKIEVGNYADLTVIDPERFWYITNNDIISNAKWTPHEGKRLWGVPIITILNGKIVHHSYENVTFNENDLYLSMPLERK